MEQLGLSLDAPLTAAGSAAPEKRSRCRVVRSRIARRSDPIGSHDAADNAQARIDNDCAQVLEALRRFPGSTTLELSRDANLDRHMVGRRATTLEDMGLAKCKVHRPSVDRPERVVDPDLEPCTASSKHVRAVRWWRTEDFPQDQPKEE